MPNWEDRFTIWSRGPSQTEKDRLDRIVKDIMETLRNDPKLSKRNLNVFPQGSYANRINVRQNSDVDVNSMTDQSYFYDVPPGDSIGNYVNPFHEATYKFETYKQEVEDALVNRYGRVNVRRGNKAIDVNNRQFDVDADVVPTFEFRDFVHRNYGGGPVIGTALKSDDGQFCTNFPQQQYDNGVAKHTATKRRYKRQVRIQKNLRNEMEQKGIAEASPMKSYLIESLIWNVPDHRFGRGTYFEDFESCMRWLWAMTETDDQASGLLESNGIKRLFSSHNPWTRIQVRAYIGRAWGYTH